MKSLIHIALGCVGIALLMLITSEEEDMPAQAKDRLITGSLYYIMGDPFYVLTVALLAGLSWHYKPGRIKGPRKHRVRMAIVSFLIMAAGGVLIFTFSYRVGREVAQIIVDRL